MLVSDSRISQVLVRRGVQRRRNQQASTRYTLTVKIRWRRCLCGATCGVVPQLKKEHLSRRRLVEDREFCSLEQGDEMEMIFLQVDDCAAPSASQ